MIKRNGVKIIVAVVLILVLSTLIYLVYDGYKKTIVNQQLQNMLGNSRSISKSIELFLDDTVDGMKVVTMDNELIKDVSSLEQGKATEGYKRKLVSYFNAVGEEMDSVYFIDKTGQIVMRYPENKEKINDIVLEDIDNAILKKDTYIGNAYFDKNRNCFILNIYQPVFENGNFKGIISAAINLNVIYDKLIAPVKVGEKGYALVKDQQGIIIMHTVKEQVGMDVIETRKKVYPNLDYKDLEKLIDDQLKGKEGTAVYYSYWWGDNELIKSKKLNAYTPVNLGEHFWVVALTMSYDEIQQPINHFLTQIIAIISLIGIILSMFAIALFRMRKNKVELEKETKYLKMINETSEQLRKKEAELYHSNKLKMIGTLAGGIAHDINNLLTPIYGFSELLLIQTENDPEYHEEVEEIYKASKKGKELVEQILMFSKKDNGILKVEPININEVTKDTIKLLKAVIPKNIVFKENLKEDCGYVNANFTQLHQVIFNLCTNAYQSMKGAEGEVEVDLQTILGEEALKSDSRLSENAIEGQKVYAEIIIKDSGSGMDEETKSRMFEPFFTTKSPGEGTGLGLFVVQSIIEKYNGAITVDSQVGVGSSFKVYLPLLGEVHEDWKIVDTYETADTHKKIFVVDDNKDILKLLKKGLKHAGYKVETETNSIKALESFKKNPEAYGLIITDFTMPKLRGNEFAAAVKAVREDIHIILMTGYMDENIEEIKNSKAIDVFLSKPLELNELYKIIGRLINK